MADLPRDDGHSDGKRVQLSDHGQKVVITNWEDVDLDALSTSIFNTINNITNGVNTAGFATQPTDNAQQYFVFVAADGGYYAVDMLSGTQVAVNPTDAGVLINTVCALMPSSTVKSEPSGGDIWMAPGEYYALTPIVLNKYGIKLHGTGGKHQVTTLRQGSFNLGATRALLEVGTDADTDHVQGVVVENLHIFGQGASWTGRGLNCWGQNCDLRNLVIQQTYNEGLVVSGTSATFLAFQNKLSGIAVVNYGMGGTTSNGLVITNTVSDLTGIEWEVSQGSVNPGYGQDGIELSGAGGMMLTDIHTWNNQRHGITLTSNGDGTLENIQSESNNQHGLVWSAADCSLSGANFYSNGYSDGATPTHVHIYMTGAVRNRLHNIRFSKVRGASANADRCILMDSGSNDNTFTQLHMRDANTDFVAIVDSHRNNFSNCMLTTHGTYAPTDGLDPSNAGFYIYGSSEKNRIHNNMITMSAAGKPAYLEDPARTGTLNVFENNTVVVGTVTLDAGSAAIVHNNAGYITEAKGSGTIVSGDTTSVISHGLSIDPVNVQITFAEDPTTDPTVCWVDTFGGATFTVHINASPGASNLDFYWRAES